MIASLEQETRRKKGLTRLIPPSQLSYEQKGKKGLTPLSIFWCMWKEGNRRAFEGEEIQDIVCTERWARDVYFCYSQRDKGGIHRFVYMTDFMSCS